MNTNLKQTRQHHNKARDIMRRKQRAAKHAQSHAFLIGEVN